MPTRRVVRIASPLVAAALASMMGGVAHADEPRSHTEPRVMMEPGEVVNVIDAFDDGDPFDVSVSLGFEYSTKSAKIRRETAIFQGGLTTGGFTSNLMNVAQFSETTSKLVPKIEVGIFRDLAAYLRLPIILSNSRRLDALEGSGDRLGVVFAGAPTDTVPLVSKLPFASPDRSGVEYLALGVDVDILNQARDRTKPTWLFGLETRFSVGTPMHACNADPDGNEVECANPGDLNRNGRSDAVAAGRQNFDAVDVTPRDPGVTRGTFGLELHTILSKRVKYVEPYGGFSALIEFQQGSSDYGMTDFEGSLVNHPPLVGTLIFGVMVIPWENREKFSRLTFDARFTGQYHSDGRDYSELFDALGSSRAESLRNPHFARFKANPEFVEDPPAGQPRQPRSVVDEGSQKTYFTGLSHVQAYGSYRGSVSATWQASEFVKFTFGVGYRYDQAHGISGDQPCNPNLKGSIEKAGPCHSGDESRGERPAPTGQPNPNYRPSISAVGRRFYVDDSNTFDIFASGVVMF